MKLKISDSVDELGRFGLPSEIEKRILQEDTYDSAYNLMGFLEYHQKYAEEIRKAVNAFWNGTDAEKAAVSALTRKLIDQLASISCKIPENTDEFKELIERIKEKTFPDFNKLKANISVSQSC